MTEIEEKLAHLIRMVDDLSDVVAKQQTTIDVMEKRVQMLMQRAAQQEADQGSYIYTGPEKPPHY
ncbi:SlyX protein [Thalassovita litoralis]|jgi:SlyX protein|uniref:SlyX protein n=1 Tax=Thalassovita litoralis TaxID=1010611 RepID=A0A521BP15_9RHOB|nr:SlyX family protein [Thalassovita litoralis]SMO48884.1 SlyX protein [Thalassovita litoralis]